ncbi:MAG: sugar ABC transporter ATP-binding protein [Nostoc sp.]|uniref:sugar ABC transporter ATP-binding protein n=1 Tax=Nostoc sp. TaxID=1180 RepID=UPI002FF41020
MTTTIETSFTDAPVSTPVLEMQGITKRFHGVSALQNVNLTIYPGEVHALMGENGAGKSTLMKILAGAYIADEGEIRINGQPLKITDPATARKSGINLIYQELNVAPNLTVTENMFMGSELRRGQFLDRKAMQLEALRDGQYIGSLTRSEISPQRLVQMMVGRSMQDFYEHQRQMNPGPVVLSVRNMSDARQKIEPTSFELHAGEILGLAGLVGAGRTELSRLIFGADRKASGEVFLNGQKLEINTPSDAIAAGIGYVPEDRKDQGLFLEMSARKNIAINTLKQDARAGIVNWASVNRLSTDAVENFNIRLANLEIRALDLSGGNQQKLLLARWLAIKPRVLMLDEPTRGVDIGAKSEIYRIMSELAAQGVAILMVSSELSEIVGMSDRVLVMREGQLVGELDGSLGKEITQEKIMHYATGASEVLAS